MRFHPKSLTAARAFSVMGLAPGNAILTLSAVPLFQKSPGVALMS
jgi:hypothetical protein